MSDIYSKSKRSAIMSRIRGKGNLKTELALVGLFRKHGIRGWRRDSRLIGRPDFIFPRLRVAVFVDGCFWHGCPDHGTQPKSNAAWWAEKIRSNMKRDRDTDSRLAVEGWTLIRIWEHEAPDVAAACVVEAVSSETGPNRPAEPRPGSA